AWGKTLPRTPASRAQILERYYRIVADGSQVFRMLQHNQASVNSLANAKNRSELFRERMDNLVGVLTGPDAPLASQIRAAVARAGGVWVLGFSPAGPAGREGLGGFVRAIPWGLPGAGDPGDAG